MPAKHHSARLFASAIARVTGQVPFAAVLACAGLLASGAKAEDGAELRSHKIIALSRQLEEATDWQSRRSSFDALVQLGMDHKVSATAPRDGIRNLVLDGEPPARASLVDALIAAVAAENRAFRNHASFSREEDALRVDLLWALAELRVPRSADVLLDAVNSGNAAVAALASFGNKSLPKVIGRLDAKPDRETKLSLMLVLLQMCDGKNLTRLSDESKATIRQRLLSALNDRDPLIRQTGCKGLAFLADPTTIPDLERVAAKDPETSIKSKKVTYPIRDEAKDAIATIRDNQPPPKAEDKVKTTR